MKRFFFFFFSFVWVLASFGSAADDYQLVEGVLLQISTAVNEGDIGALFPLLSPQAEPELREKLQSLQQEQINVHFDSNTLTLRRYDENRIRAEVWLTTRRGGWEIDGKTYFLFEISADRLLLIDTDFPEKTRPEYVFKFVGFIILIVFIISLPLTAFWVWMLVDAVKRDFENKVAWIVILALTSFIGAIIYYFTIRRAAKRIEKNIKLKKKL